MKLETEYSYRQFSPAKEASKCHGINKTVCFSTFIIHWFIQIKAIVDSDTISYETTDVH